MSTAEIEIGRASIYGLTREKRRKKISNEWILDNTKLSSRTYSVLSNFLYKNLVILVNAFEIPRLEKKEIRPPIHIEGGDPRRERAISYVTSFADREKGALLLNDLRFCRDDDSFSACTRKVSQLFLATPFWPRTYLFVTQFSIKHESFTDDFTGIMTTRLHYGQLAEDPRRVISQIKSGVIGDTIKKAAIYPHIFEKDGKATSEPYVKVYEDTPRPAKYFYRFLFLDYPVGTQEFAEKLYKEEVKEKELSLDEFVELLKKEDPEILNHVRLRTSVDRTVTSSSLSDFHKKIRFIRLDDKEYFLLVRGAKVSVLLGKKDLVEDGLINFMTKTELASELLKGK